MQAGDRGSTGVRLGAGVALLSAAALLLVPVAALPRLTWDDLIAPLAVGLPVAEGYVLSPPRRDAGAVVYVARRAPTADRPAARVEVHIMSRGRWPGIAETRSFGVGWEVPPPGASDAAPEADMRAVTDALAGALASNDTGFANVVAIPFASEPEPPLVARVLDRLAGPRGVVVGAAVASGLVALAGVPGGTAIVAGLLLGLGLALRAPALDVPFVRDQDVQRLLTGNSSLLEIATGAGLKDRHPPLYFFVLHAVQRFGQSEAIGRAPAVVAGALIGPALLLAAVVMRGRSSAVAVLAALAVAVSPELVRDAREVSEIPLFALLVIVAATTLVAALRRPLPGRCRAMALAHATLLYTYYLAPFVIAAHAGVLAWQRPPRRVATAFAVGVLAGVPAVGLAVITLLGDAGARSTARGFPTLAWGEHSPGQMLADMARMGVAAFGMPFAGIVLLALVAALIRGDVVARLTAGAVIVTITAIALLSPIARVQPYYVTAVLPLAALTVAVAPLPAGQVAVAAVLAVAIAGWTIPSLATARTLYLADPDAFMPSVAKVVAERPEPTVIVVAHYDKALLAYYLARRVPRPIAWYTQDMPGGKRIEPLVMVHALSDGFQAEAAQRLDRILADGPALVVDRDAVSVSSIARRLTGCERLLEAPTARLLRCAPEKGGAAPAFDVSPSGS